RRGFWLHGTNPCRVGATLSGCSVGRAALVAVATTVAAARAFLGARDVDHDRAAADGHAVQTTDGGLGLFGRAHLDKAETLGAAAVAVHHDLGGRDVAKLGEIVL